MRACFLVFMAVLTACAPPGEKSALRKKYLAALESSTEFDYRKTVGAGGKSDTESRVGPRPENFADDFPSDESYFYDSPRNIGCFDVSNRGDTIVATVKNECVKRTPLLVQKLLWQGDTLKFVAFDVRQSNEIYEIKLFSEVWFDENGKYRRHRLNKNYRLKFADLRLATTLMGERVD